jgi:flagellar export protein FliJ
MRGLQNLIRIHKSKLEAERRKLSELEALGASFARQIEALLETAEAEGRAAGDSPETAHAIGAFVQGALARVRTLRGSLADVERETAGIRERIHEAFRELKRYEIVEERRVGREQFAERRRDRIAEDEIGLGLHRRNARLQAG